MITTLAAAGGILATYPALAVAGIFFGVAFIVQTGRMAYDDFRGAR